MKISLITVVFNNASSIADCIRSIASQSHSGINHIIIDGGSTDGTVDIIKEWQQADKRTSDKLANEPSKRPAGKQTDGPANGKGQRVAHESGLKSGEPPVTNHDSRITNVVSEPDNGLYDAMNKGLRLADGDIIGILNSDDVFADEHVVSRVVRAMTEQGVDSCYADIDFVDRDDTSKVVRRWRSGPYEKKRFHYGWMPPHPTFFVKRSVYENFGLLDLDFPLAADYELMLRFLYKHNISTTYIPEVLVKMRTGGTSRPGMYTLRSIAENYRAWKVNGLPYPPAMLLKPVLKMRQYLTAVKSKK